MPPPKNIPPEFHPVGRYLIDVKARREAREAMVADRGKQIIFHDTDNVQEACGYQDTPTSYLSRFNNKEWAEVRGFKPCPVCQT